MSKSDTDLQPTLDLTALSAWLDLLRPLRVPAQAAQAEWIRLIAAYGEPGRYYHTLTHLRDVLGWIARLNADPADQPALDLAVWYHDAVYDPRAADNEARSAAWAGQTLNGWGLPAPLVARVQALILATQTHDAGDDPVAALLLDADLAILGAGAAEYARYAAAIRQEYAWVPEDQYRAGRRAVLTRFLARPHIYQTETMRAAHEEAARQNVLAELARLA